MSYSVFFTRDERSQVTSMVNKFKYDFGHIHVFIILFKQSDNRMKDSMWNMLRMFQAMFGPGFWSNAILEATHWNYSPYLVDNLNIFVDSQIFFVCLHILYLQSRVRAESGINESQWSQQFNSILREEFNFDFDLPAVFVDTFHKRAGRDSHIEVEKFRAETGKLWDFVQSKLGRYLPCRVR